MHHSLDDRKDQLLEIKINKGLDPQQKDAVLASIIFKYVDNPSDPTRFNLTQLLSYQRLIYSITGIKETEIKHLVNKVVRNNKEPESIYDASFERILEISAVLVNGYVVHPETQEIVRAEEVEALKGKGLEAKLLKDLKTPVDSKIIPKEEIVPEVKPSLNPQLKRVKLMSLEDQRRQDKQIDNLFKGSKPLI